MCVSARVLLFHPRRPEDLLKYLSDVKRANCHEGSIGSASRELGCLSLTKAQCGYLLAESMQMIFRSVNAAGCGTELILHWGASVNAIRQRKFIKFLFSPSSLLRSLG
jgi:hypothetical protein